jgi:hypothetical protein
VCGFFKKKILKRNSPSCQNFVTHTKNKNKNASDHEMMKRVRGVGERGAGKEPDVF